MNAKQVCTLGFILFDNICIVTIIASDVSGFIILININFFDTMSIHKSVHKITVDTYRITINTYDRFS